MVEVCQGKDEMVVAREQDNAAKQRVLEKMEVKVVSLVEQCTSLREELARKTEELFCRNMDIRRLQVIHFLLKHYKLGHYSIANHLSLYRKHSFLNTGLKCNIFLS